MEISLPNPPLEAQLSESNGVISESAASPIVNEDKILVSGTSLTVSVSYCLRHFCTCFQFPSFEVFFLLCLNVVLYFSRGVLKILQHSADWRCPVGRWEVCWWKYVLTFLIFDYLVRAIRFWVLVFQNVIFDSLEFFELFELEMCLSQFTLLEDEVVNFVFSNCRMLEKRSLSYVDGPIPVPLDDAFLADNVQGIRICDSGILFFNYTHHCLGIEDLEEWNV